MEVNLQVKTLPVQETTTLPNQEELDQDLIYSIGLGDLYKVQTALDQGANVNRRKRYIIYTPLTFAIFQYKFSDKVIKILLSHKNIDVNIPKDSFTPLMVVAFKCNFIVIKLLLERRDIKVNLRNSTEGMTALMFALKYKDEPDLLSEFPINCSKRMVQFFLKRNDINLDILDNYNKSVYDYAQTEEIKMLLRNYTTKHNE